MNMNDVEALLQNEDHIGIRGGDSASSNSNQQTSYLFSPLRASIVYSRFQIMVNLMEYGANVYELFGVNFDESAAVMLTRQNSSKTNEDFVNALKLLHRQFGPFITQNKNNQLIFNEYDKCLNKLNEFIACPNVYRRMLLEFVKNVCLKINYNLNLATRLDLFMNSTSKNTLEHVLKLTDKFEANFSLDDLEWSDYVNIVSDFVVSIDFLLSNEQTLENPATEVNNAYGGALNQLSRKPNFHQNLFDFAKFLMQKFFAPKSLKELCRFKLRKLVFERIARDQAQYGKKFSKRDHQLTILNSFHLPNYLITYLLHSN